MLKIYLDLITATDNNNIEFLIKITSSQILGFEA